ncbi:MAG: MBL fold metallo-hydrolase [Staphylococcus sp.]|nr:MBL fold metallo-hydrolase [Staphylococcus sp.]
MIHVECFCDDSTHANTYLIEEDGHVIVVDPANHMKVLQRYIGNQIVDGCLLTHGHYDHFRELENFLQLYPNCQCYLHKEAKRKLLDLNLSYASAFGCKKVPMIDENKLVLFSNATKMKIGHFLIEVMITPGHTNCSSMYVIGNAIFSGDTLFKGSVGRTDLWTGNPLQQKQTLQKIRLLKQNYVIYPGHDEATTLLEEIQNNPYLN